MNRAAVLAIVTIACAHLNVANAIPLTFSFSDPVGDNTGSIDVVGLTFNFDNGTGDYEIELTADAANPFFGDFRVNINLFNPDTGTTNVDPSLFSDTVNDLSLGVSTTVLVLTGTENRLLSWDPGDRVAISGPNPLGVPDFVAAFGSSVIDLPFVDPVVFDNIAAGEFTTISEFVSVPVPTSLALMSLVAGGWLAFNRRRKLRRRY